MAIDHSLVLDIERIERAAWTDLAAVMPAALAGEIGLQAGAVGAAYLFMASRIPLFQFNWLSGAGLNGDDGTSIAEAVRRFRGAGQKKFIIQLPPGPNVQRCEARAREAGLVESPLAWAKFHRAATVTPVVNTALTIRALGPGEGELFAATAVEGFGMPPGMRSWLINIVGRPHWHTYVSFDGSTPVGAAAMYVDGEHAWLGIGATIAASRKRGSQSALLARRIADAARFGAKHVSTETGVPQAGQPAPSYQNILRAGFEVLYVRPNWSEPAS